MKFKVVLYESEEGVSIKCPTLPGCITQGETVAEALEEIQIAIREFLEAIWGEVNKGIAEDLAENGDLKVNLGAVDIDGVEYERDAMKFKVVLYESDEGVSVQCPGLPGCITQGDTVAEALEEIQIAIREFLEALWGEVNKGIAEDLAEYGDLKVSVDEVEVDIEGVEHSQPQVIEAAV